MDLAFVGAESFTELSKVSVLLRDLGSGVYSLESMAQSLQGFRGEPLASWVRVKFRAEKGGLMCPFLLSIPWTGSSDTPFPLQADLEYQSTSPHLRAGVLGIFSIHTHQPLSRSRSPFTFEGVFMIGLSSAWLRPFPWFLSIH